MILSYQNPTKWKLIQNIQKEVIVTDIMYLSERNMNGTQKPDSNFTIICLIYIDMMIGGHCLLMA